MNRKVRKGAFSTRFQGAMQWKRAVPTRSVAEEKDAWARRARTAS